MKLPTTCKLLSAGCLLLPYALLAYGQNCYYPNGALANTDDHPCSTDGHSTCCPLNWQCLSNGLCFLPSEGYLGRYTCTDSSWQSDKCPKICLYDGTAAGNEAIQHCSTDSYCCDANRPEIDCCQTSNDFFSLPDGTVVASIGADSPKGPLASQSSRTTALPSRPATGTLVAAKSSVPPTTETTVVSSTDSQSKTETAKTTKSTSVPASSIIFITSVVTGSAGVSFTSIMTQIVEGQIAPSSSVLSSTQGSSASSTGLKIGLGVGIPVGVIVLALVGFFLWRRRSKNRRRPPKFMENARMNGANPVEYMYKGQGDADSPLTAATTSPDLNQRASSKYVVSDTSEGGYRGVKTGGHGGLGLQPGFSGLPPISPTRSELSGDPSVPRDHRDSHMSELAAPTRHPSELPDRPY